MTKDSKIILTIGLHSDLLRSKLWQASNKYSTTAKRSVPEVSEN